MINKIIISIRIMHVVPSSHNVQHNYSLNSKATHFSIVPQQIKSARENMNGLVGGPEMWLYPHLLLRAVLRQPPVMQQYRSRS